jgi:hypothetical protein
VLLLKGSDYKPMVSLIQQIKENGEEDVVVEGVPVCGANLVSPVTDTANFIREVHYKIGTRLYRKCRLETEGNNLKKEKGKKKEIKISKT